jgi:hypothetical protein
VVKRENKHTWQKGDFTLNTLGLASSKTRIDALGLVRKRAKAVAQPATLPPTMITIRYDEKLDIDEINLTIKMRSVFLKAQGHCAMRVLVNDQQEEISTKPEELITLRNDHIHRRLVVLSDRLGACSELQPYAVSSP